MEEPDEDVTFSVNLRAYVYHQLGLLYFHRARRSQDTKMSSEMYKKAMIAAKKAVASNQTQYIFWNSLGVISYCKDCEICKTNISCHVCSLVSFILLVV